MSTVKVNTLTGTSTAGSIAVTGEGNSTTTNLQQGLAKAWAKFDAGSTLNDSFNVSTLTDSGTGKFDLAFTNNMGNANYSGIGQGNNSGFCSYASSETTGETTTSKTRLNTRNYVHNNFDGTLNRFIVHGDLA
tara:strand:- start:27 stop:425 length:399 start_codon:yes stop_codon:yes gene_type:complete